MSRGPAKKFDKSQALSAALAVFWKNGYDGAALSQLLSAMNIGRQSFYDTFGSKRQLFDSAIVCYAERATVALRAALQSSERPPLENVREVLIGWARRNASQQSLGCVFGNSLTGLGSRDPEVAEILRPFILDIERCFEHALERARAEGSLHTTVHIPDAARMLVSLGQGIAVLGRVHRDEQILTGIATSALKALEA